MRVRGVSMVRRMMVLEVDECISRVVEGVTSDSALSSGQEG